MTMKRLHNLLKRLSWKHKFLWRTFLIYRIQKLNLYT